MSETGESVIVTEQKRILPVGEVIIGKKDPRTLSEVEFDAHPDILYHGSVEPFEYSTNHDYSKNIGPHSMTAGAGLYTTPSREDAALYSRQWGAKDGEETVTSFLPFQAKMYDFRDKSDLTSNAPVTKDFLNEYRQFIIRYIKNRFPETPPGFNEEYQSLNNYRSTLNTLYFSDLPVDLRVMLSEKGDPSTSEFGAQLFKTFFDDKGIDGLIYVEGGDHKDHQNPVSYVFFNLKKVGTYASWHKD